MLVELKAPWRRHGPGKVLKLPDKEARRLIDRGDAIAAPADVTAPAPEPARELEETLEICGECVPVSELLEAAEGYEEQAELPDGPADWRSED
jgi:hypothetical protein